MCLRTVSLAGTPALKQLGSELGLHGVHGSAIFENMPFEVGVARYMYSYRTVTVQASRFGA